MGPADVRAHHGMVCDPEGAPYSASHVCHHSPATENCALGDALNGTCTRILPAQAAQGSCLEPPAKKRCLRVFKEVHHKTPSARRDLADITVNHQQTP